MKPITDQHMTKQALNPMLILYIFRFLVWYPCRQG